MLLHRSEGTSNRDHEFHNGVEPESHDRAMTNPKSTELQFKITKVIVEFETLNFGVKRTTIRRTCAPILPSHY